MTVEFEIPTYGSLSSMDIFSPESCTFQHTLYVFVVACWMFGRLESGKFRPEKGLRDSHASSKVKARVGFVDRFD